jgi:hypothetical protein
MKKYFIYLICCLLACLKVIAQNNSLKIDSLKKVLLAEKPDTNKINTLIDLAHLYKGLASDTTLYYYFDALKLAEEISKLS